MPEVWYRYNGYTTTGCGLDKYVVSCYELPVIGHTSKGVWLDDFGSERFVLLEARKKYANPSKEGALEDFIKRKQRQRKILKANIEAVDGWLCKASLERLSRVDIGALV